MVSFPFEKNDNYEQYICTEATLSFLYNIFNQIHVILNDHWFLQNYNRNLSRCVKIKPDTKATASALTVNLDYPGQNFPKNSA